MIVSVSSDGNTLDATVSPVFARCPYYVFYDLDKDTYEVVPNPSVTSGGGAGAQAAQLIVNKGAKAMISGNVGPNAASVLQSAGVKMFIGEQASVKEAVEKFKAKKLRKVSIVAQTGRELNQSPLYSEANPNPAKDLTEIKEELKRLSEKTKELEGKIEKLEKG